MEFSGQYLTYEEYVGLGGTLNIMPFNLLEFEARRQIDMRTQNRLKDGEEDIPQEVKLCEYKLIERINEYLSALNESGKNSIASESTDGYSISYITADRVSGIVSSESEELKNIIREYLLGVIYEGQHLMYAGVR